MAKKKGKKRNPKPAQALVRLSQVMIVKNEEKNIEKALSWGKGVVCEQIVVDTGSTDRTVEIAEEMGAKVFHFEWIDDFSAAKNYAIEQASGNWIAFLDADEFFSQEDAKKLVTILKKIHAEPELLVKCLAINCPLVNVNDDGKVFSVYNQERVFRNLHKVRYIGKIHERVGIPAENIFSTDDVTVIHTGYSESAFEDTQKSVRNMEILRRELEERPNDGNIQMYLADSLRNIGGEENFKEALMLYAKATARGSDILPGIKMEGFRSFIRLSLNCGVEMTELEDICRCAIQEFPIDADFGYYLGLCLNRQERYEEAMVVLKRAEATLLSSGTLESATIVSAEPKLLFSQLVLASYHLKDAQSTIRYGMMVLAEDKTQLSILSHCIATFVDGGVSDDEIIRVLSKIYDFGNPKDAIAVARAAAAAGATELAKTLLAMTGLTESSLEPEPVDSELTTTEAVNQESSTPKQKEAVTES